MDAIRLGRPEQLAGCEIQLPTADARQRLRLFEQPRNALQMVVTAALIVYIDDRAEHLPMRVGAGTDRRRPQAKPPPTERRVPAANVDLERPAGTQMTHHRALHDAAVVFVHDRPDAGQRHVAARVRQAEQLEHARPQPQAGRGQVELPVAVADRTNELRMLRNGGLETFASRAMAALGRTKFERCRDLCCDRAQRLPVRVGRFSAAVHHDADDADGMALPGDDRSAGVATRSDANPVGNEHVALLERELEHGVGPRRAGGQISDARAEPSLFILDEADARRARITRGREQTDQLV